jgi:hypothetical protein
MVACLSLADNWEFDIFALAQLTPRPLYVLSHHIFVRLGLLDKFDVDQETFSNFMRALGE